VSGAVAVGLRHSIGRSGYFTLAFGAIVGSGWVVVLGDWLKAAGPGGVAVGFLAGSVVMVMVALCYGELAARSPHAGGEFLYTVETLGVSAGFFVGWYLTLYAVAVCAFEAVAFGWMLRTLFPGIGLDVAYRVHGAAVTWDALLAGLAATVMIGWLHYRGALSAIRFQNIVTYSFIGVSIFVMATGFTMGHIQNLRPLFYSPGGESELSGVLWIFSNCAFFLAGWQASLHAIEEKRAVLSIRAAMTWIAAAIVAAACFYSGVVLSASSAVPWRGLVSRELPAVAAFGSLTAGGALGTLVLVAAIVSLSKTWSAVTWIASRLILAQARHGMLPAMLAAVDPESGAPRRAVLVVSALTMIGVVAGRSAILPIVNMVAMCLALSMILCLAVLIRRRQRDDDVPAFTVPGGKIVIAAAMIGAMAMVAIALVKPLLNANGGVPIEWILLGVWGLLGLLVWIGMNVYRRRT
jgi:basic amino acid/polyamine antiporter, APA family